MGKERRKKSVVKREIRNYWIPYLTRSFHLEFERQGNGYRLGGMLRAKVLPTFARGRTMGSLRRGS